MIKSFLIITQSFSPSFPPVCSDCQFVFGSIPCGLFLFPNGVSPLLHSESLKLFSFQSSGKSSLSSKIEYLKEVEAFFPLSTIITASPFS